MKYLLGSLSLLLFFSCGVDEVLEPEPTPLPDVIFVWEGPMISFEKADGADPTEASNQDRINDDVWITRGNSGGQIYNIAEESSASKDTSPSGTLWAVGDIADIDSLTFSSFRSAVGSPSEVVGKKLVMYLEDANVYLSVEFTSWSGQHAGGFAYMRSTPN